MILPTAYGRKDDSLFFHGSTKNFALNEMLKNDLVSVAISHLDGIVLARTLFNTSANYRSAILQGRVTLLTSEEERMEGLRIITENISPGRWDEVELGSESEIKATMIVRFDIESASVKIRGEGPSGDENSPEKVWSGHIPLRIVADQPVPDPKNQKGLPETDAIINTTKKYL